MGIKTINGDHKHQVTYVVINEKVVGQTDVVDGHSHTFAASISKVNDVLTMDKPEWINKFSQGVEGTEHSHDVEWPEDFKFALGSWKTATSQGNPQDAYKPDGTGNPNDEDTAKKKKDEDGLPVSKDEAGSVQRAVSGTGNFLIKDQRVFKIGKWNDSEWSAEDGQKMADNYNRFRTSFEPPLKGGHREGESESAYGWAINVRFNNPFVIADFSVPQDVYADYLKTGKLRYKSSEIARNFKRDGKEYGPTLIGVALLGTNIPAVDDLEAIGLPYQDKIEDVFHFTFEIEEDEMSEKDRLDFTVKIDEMNKRQEKLELSNTVLLAKLRAKEVNTYASEQVRKGVVLPVNLDCFKELCRSLSDEQVLTFSQTIVDAEGKSTAEDTKLTQLNLFKTFMETIKPQVELDNESAEATEDETKVDTPELADTKKTDAVIKNKDIKSLVEKNDYNLVGANYHEYALKLQKDNKDMDYGTAIEKAYIALESK